MRDPLGAVWLVASGVLIGVLLSLAAVRPQSIPVAATVDAGVDAPRSMVATPEHTLRLPIASHCTPESGWPCEPSH